MLSICYDDGLVAIIPVRPELANVISGVGSSGALYTPSGPSWKISLLSEGKVDVGNCRSLLGVRVK
jgi:hypothetical protein